jgi:hypothetical protein
MSRLIRPKRDFTSFMDASMTPAANSPHPTHEGAAPPASDQLLERLLASALVPIEPSPAFASRLHARLVTHRGGGLQSPWFVIGVGAASLLLATAWMGLALRLLFVLLSLLGIVQGSRKGSLKRQHIAS